MNSIIAANRKSWDFAVGRQTVWKNSLAEHIRSGDHLLFPDLHRIADNEPPTSILQPFCNDGSELISLCQRYGCSGIGIDFSENAIGLARRVNAELGGSCSFVESEVLDWLTLSESNFQPDLCVTTLGSLWWLSDLERYFDLLANRIKANGRAIIWDFHPCVHCFDDNLVFAAEYPFGGRLITHTSGIVDYTNKGLRYDTHPGSEASNPHPVTYFAWDLPAIMQAAIHSGDWGLIEYLEYPFIWGEPYFAAAVPVGEKRYGFPDSRLGLPLSFVMVLRRRTN